MKRGIYRLSVDYGRSGSIEGIFITNDKYVEYLINHKIEVYFGEILGKHSEVICIIDEDELKLVTNDPNAVYVFELYDLSSGYNPFDASTASGEDIIDVIHELMEQDNEPI